MINKLLSKLKHKKNQVMYYLKKYGFMRTVKKCVIRFPKEIILIVRIIHNRIIKQTDYKLWIKNNEPTKIELEEQKKYEFRLNPKISIIVPMYKTPIKYFKQLIRALIEQTYCNWELCLADGSPKLNKKIETICKKDQRIKYHFISENKGISGNSNEALELATGDYIALLDHDDTLPLFSLYEIVKCINNNPTVEFIYSDEDKITKNNIRFFPNFKPDFSPDFLRDNNYICHFSIFKKELMSKLGGFRSEYDGSQDHDLVLRMSEETRNIIHIPKVLYHWRTLESSFSNASTTKNKSWEAGKMAVQDHINRLGIKGTVYKSQLFGRYRIIYEILNNSKISILIPNREEKDSLERCINSILKLSTYKNYEIIIIENNSKSKDIFEYYEELQKNDKIKVIKYETEKGFNYSKIINFGVENADGEYIIQLNNDTEIITNNWIEEMLGFAQRKDVGIVGAKLCYFDQTIQHAGVIIGLGEVAAHSFRHAIKNSIMANQVKNLSAVTGACMMCKKRIFEEVRVYGGRISSSF